ncbi:unnamed protein product [Lupinus luteus]|uniref:RING-type domain-containing protein n=1 Tax=Lupinus luteus TaxID=3873 RepID=A0AAV1Y0R6_LUPLU
MDDTNPERNNNIQTDHYPLLMEQLETHNVHEHIIDITRNDEVSSSSSHNGQRPGMHIPQIDDEQNGSTQLSTHQRTYFSASRNNSRNSSSPRSEEYGHHRWNPLNSGLWISVELAVALSQIIASIVVLSLSRNENPQAPLFLWILDEENSRATESARRSARIPGPFSSSCIGYAMPFILCATICCCLPCIISILGIQEDFSQNRGASAVCINALPIYKFKMKENENSGVKDVNAAIDEGGVLAAGTEKERLISREDAACCICLAKYVDDDELRELPCFHVFHVECIDKWLKINASCPLCKSEVDTSNEQSTSASRQRLSRR